ncbi:hypothetical protein J6590_090939 [Homalodisca vitripennis]|nr:hypothetical protein J6590_090939 [Homalodisca vitripennis]
MLHVENANKIENEELPSVQRIFIQPPEVDGDTSAEDSADEDDGGKLDNLPKTQLAGFGEAVLADGTRMGDEHDEEQGMPRLITTCDLTEEPKSSGISGIGRLTDEATTTPNLKRRKPCNFLSLPTESIISKLKFDGIHIRDEVGKKRYKQRSQVET